MTTVKCLLAQSSKQLAPISDSANLDSQVLLCHAVNKDRTFIYTHPDYKPTQTEYKHFQKLLDKRIQGWPIAYLIGHKEFWSLEFKVTPDVLIPRPETEVLVQTVLNKLPKDKNLTIVDLGTGSGAIAIALATERPNWQIIATDQSQQALAIAKTNAKLHNCNNIEFIAGSWCDALPSPPVVPAKAGIQTFKLDAIISNPPYIDQNEPELNQGDVRFEPKSALIATDNGLADIKLITKQAITYLKSGGLLAFEHGYQQAEQVKSILEQYGFINIEQVQDLAGHTRITTATR